MRRRTFLRCLPAAPALVVVKPAVATPAEIIDPNARGIGDEVDGREVVEMCEACSKPLFEGDLAFSYADGPVMCEEHAPTWNDLKDQQDEGIAAGDFKDWFEEEQHAIDARDLVLGQIADGKGDQKYVWAL